jgi:hypothetical protein
MTMIINPNAPKGVSGVLVPGVKQPNPLEIMVEMFKVLDILRRQFFKLEEMLTAENLTATEIDDLTNSKQQIAQAIVDFVLYEKAP